MMSVSISSIVGGREGQRAASRADGLRDDAGTGNNTGMIGVANEPFFVMMRDVLDKGLARLEGYVKRGDTASVGFV